MKIILFLFLSIFFFLQSSQETEITDLLPFCIPSPALLNIEKNSNGVYSQDCRNIPIYPPILTATNREFKCCEVSLKKKSGSGVSPINGCIAIMSSYIDDDRYEDMIDYFERGKQYKLRNYFIMLGNSTFIDFYYKYLPMVNGTKYEVEKFDCFSEYKWVNIVLILELLFLIY